MKGIVTRLQVNDGNYIFEKEKLDIEQGYGAKFDFKASFFSPCHILITTENEMIASGYNSGDLSENITIKDLDINSVPIGSIISIGEVKFKLMYENEKCKIIAPKMREKRGVLAVALTSGQIYKGSSVTVINELSNESYSSRKLLFISLLNKVPCGKIISYSEVILAIGGKKAHLRVIPMFLKYAYDLGLPVHRIVNTNFRLLPQYVSNQKELLEMEGIKVIGDVVDKQFLWVPTNNIFCDE